MRAEVLNEDYPFKGLNTAIPQNEETIRMFRDAATRDRFEGSFRQFTSPKLAQNL